MSAANTCVGGLIHGLAIRLKTGSPRDRLAVLENATALLPKQEGAEK
jgi:hypothetical protein